MPARTPRPAGLEDLGPADHLVRARNDLEESAADVLGFLILSERVLEHVVLRVAGVLV
jgi:hypothetical protein